MNCPESTKSAILLFCGDVPHHPLFVPFGKPIPLLGDFISQNIGFCDMFIIKQKPRSMPASSISETTQCKEVLFTVRHKLELHSVHGKRLLPYVTGCLAARKCYRRRSSMLHVVGLLASPKTYSCRERAGMKLNAWTSSAPSYSGRKQTS
jgi:hypothetical protein